MPRSIVEIILTELVTTFRPLLNAVNESPNGSGLIRLAQEVGYDIEGSLTQQQFDDFASNIRGIYSILRTTIDDPAGLIAHIPELIQNITQFSEALDDLATELPPGAELATRIIDYLIVSYLEIRMPVLFNALILTGAVRRDHVAATDGLPAYNHRQIVWDQFPKLLDIGNAAKELYFWGDPNFESNLLLARISDLLWAIGIPAVYDGQRIPGTDGKMDLFWSFDIGIISNYLGATALYLDADGNNLPGLSLVPTGGTTFSTEFEVLEGWVTHIEFQFGAESGYAIQVRPGSLVIDSLPSQPAVDWTLGAQFDLTPPVTPGTPTILLGSPGSTRLEAGSINFGASGVAAVDQGEFLVEFSIRDGQLVVGLGGADGFISSLLPDSELSVGFDFTIGLSTRAGIYFKGSASLEISLPIHLTLGPIVIDIIYLNITPGDSSDIQLELSATFSLSLGPIAGTVERIGTTAALDFSNRTSPLDLSFLFKPPSGVGLVVDAGVVTGGGYLFFDFDKEEYAGVLELDLSGIVSVKAIGLITTRLPDGSQGFSLLLIITAEFGSPIQLGFGFTLSAVGGLLGLNRTMRLEAIATGIRDGGINSIMFPQNVVENAPRIISDLKNYFPVEEDIFLIGPMVQIGWGTPNLVTVSLGIIIEIPGNIAILGVLKVVLPDEEAALIVIQVNFIGAIEFDKERLWFFAAIFESRVLFITLEGEMGLLVGWGADASFVVSVGGFHPAFNPPPLPFGAIARISISILNTDFARIQIQGYFAVTSNSVQFGASATLFFGLDAFNIDGHLAFDALFRFSPFYFIITISASLSVKVFGVGLFSVRMRGSLEGPTPWHVEGTGSISLLFFDIDVDFSHTWGNEAETTLPPISVMPLLLAEYQKSENWLAALPASNQLLVSLRSTEGGEVDLVLHPVGSLMISQRAVPLGLTIDKVGNQKPSDANHFDITVSTTGLDESGRIDESFAVGQYFDKSDDELLSAKSFEPMKGGVELSVAGEQYHAPEAVKRVVRYEKIIIDTNFKRFTSMFYTWIGSLFSLFLKGNSVSKSPLSYKQQKELKPFTEKITVGNTLYTVAFNEDNTAFNEEAMGFNSQVEAQEFMNRQVAADANLAQQLHVIPLVEMQRTE